MDIKSAIEHLNEILSDDSRWKQCEECKNEHVQLKEWLEELQQYHKIGTIDEYRTVMEKRIEKMVICETEDDREYEDYICPNCKTICKSKNCHYCGQALKWGD